MYAELKLKVDEYTSSATNKNLNVKLSSPQREIDEQSDNIKLREINLKNALSPDSHLHPI